MFSLAVTAAILASAPTPKLASPGWSFINVEPKKGDFFADYFAQQLAVRGVRVTTKSEISTLLGFERQKQLMGCANESSSCVAELAGALGVDGLIVGSIAKFKAGYTVNIKIVGATDGSQLAVASTKSKDDDQLVEWLSEVAEKVAPELLKKLEPEKPKEKEPEVVATKPVETLTPKEEPKPAPVEVTEQQPSKPMKMGPILAGAGAVVALGAGTFALIQAKSIHDELLKGTASSYYDPDIDVASKRSADAASQGNLMKTIGYAGLGVGVALGATAAALAFTGGDDDSVVAISASPDGFGLVLSGVIP